METLVRASLETAESAGQPTYRMADGRSSATILLVEVEPLLTDSIKYTLERDGHQVVAAATREEGLAAVAGTRPALIVAEAGQSATEVAEFCGSVRSLSAAPIIVITPEISSIDRTDAQRTGADDVLAKPFSVREIAQRIAAQLRGDGSSTIGSRAEDETLRVGPVEMDVANHEVWVRGKIAVFPPKEFALLETLLRSRGRLIKRERLIGTVWGANYFGDGKTLDTHIKRLRKKIELDPRRPRHLVVVRGMGYRFLDRQQPA